MGELFLTIINMSLTAGYVILFVILIRLPLKKAPKIISYALWGVAAFRLTIPFSFESIVSLMPRYTNAVPIPHDIIYQQSPQISGGLEAVGSFTGNSLSSPSVGASVNPLQVLVEIGAYIWVIGVMALLVYSLVSISVLKSQLKSAQSTGKDIFEAGNLKTPFVLGLIRPKIYLPVGLNVEERNYILLHEQTHIRRKDYIIKILAFLTLSVHWFNPLVWIAFMLMSKDMDLSCDERVLKQMNNEDIKKPYANSLLSLATGKHILNGSPLAFGEGNVSGRIKNVLNYKRPRFWAILASLIVLIGAGIALLSNPAESDTLSTAVTGNEISDNAPASATPGELPTVNPEPVPTMSGGLPEIDTMPEVYPGYDDFINAELLPNVYWETDNKTDSPLDSEVVSIPSGRLAFAFLLTPPYEEKSIFIDEATLNQIISEIAYAKVLPDNNQIDWSQADFQDNGLNLYVLTGGNVYNSIELWGPIYCNNDVYVNISVMSIMGGKVPNKYGTWRIESQGLGQILVDFWKQEFDLQRFHDVTRIDMSFPKYNRENADKKATIEGDDAKHIAERMLETSKIDNGGACTPDIKICFTFADGTTELGWLNGDGCPGIELDNGTFITFDKEIMRELYKLLDYGEGFIPE